MKKSKLLLLLSLGLLLTSCKADENDLNLTSDFLDQTSWSGTASLAGSPVAQLGIEFSSKTAGSYTHHDMDSDYGSGAAIIYQVDKKKLTIDLDPNVLGSSSFLVGNWFLIEKNDNRLVFKQNLYSENQVWTLELNRRY